MTIKNRKDSSERESLEAEKIELAKKIGIWEECKLSNTYQETAEFKRIQEIDTRLFEIVNE